VLPQDELITNDLKIIESIDCRKYGTDSKKKEAVKESGTKVTSISTKSMIYEEKIDGNYISIVKSATTAQGPNVNLAKGPKDDLLL
jgi:hypothetical protein